MVKHEPELHNRMGAAYGHHVGTKPVAADVVDLAKVGPAR